MPSAAAFQRCMDPGCGATYGVGEIRTACAACGSLLDVAYEWDRASLPVKASGLGRPGRRSEKGPGRVSGVWRFGALLDFAPPPLRATIGEGHTQLRPAPKAGAWAGIRDLRLQYEGLNPSGSFKDNGMAGAFTHARLSGARVTACASTGNTSASMAAFAAAGALGEGGGRPVIFIGDGKIAYGKLSQALDYGALTLLVKGDFDDAMARVAEVCARERIYLVNSVNPFRLEGQKTTMYRVLEGYGWEAPDWIVCPGGNLGNSSAFGKALRELHELGYLPRVPRLAVINSAGAPTLDRLVNGHKITWNGGKVDRSAIAAYYAGLDRTGERANTLASAIEINRPVNLLKCLRALEWTDGVARSVTDQEILDAKAQVAREGLGCEPASAASVAGARKLVAEGVIDPGSRVACVLTGHQLKDPHATVAYHSSSEADLARGYAAYGVRSAPHANRPVAVANDLDQILRVLRERS